MFISNKHQSRKSNWRKGFTLVELMVAMLVTLIIVGVLVSVTRTAMDSWQDSQNRTKSSRQAKEVINTLAKDLESIVIQTGNNNFEWVLIKAATDKLGPSGSSSKALPNPIEITFFSGTTERYGGQIGDADADKGGDVSAVRLRIAYQDQIGTGSLTGEDAHVFSVYREIIDPNVAFNKMLAKTSLDGLIPSADISDPNNFLAENVYDLTLTLNFEVTKLVSGKPVTSVVSYPIQAGGTNKDISIKGNSISVDGVAIKNNPRLLSADISLLVLSDKGMSGLKRTPINDKAALARFIDKHGYHYSKTVILPNP